MNTLATRQQTAKAIMIYKNDLKTFDTSSLTDDCVLKFDDNKTKELFDKHMSKKVKKRIGLRYYLWKMEKYKMLDLSLIKMEIVNTFLYDVDLFTRFSQIEHLSLNNCKLSSIPDLSMMIKLETIDLSNNLLSEFPIIPKQVKEIIISYNKIITNIKVTYNVERLDISHNKITIMPETPNVKKLDISNNEIKNLAEQYKELEELICNNNEIENLPHAPNIHTLNCSHNKIRVIKDFIYMKFLIANGLEIEYLGNFPSITEIDLINTNIPMLPYYKNLLLLTTNVKKNSISKEYKIDFYRENCEGYMEIFFKN